MDPVERPQFRVVEGTRASSLRWPGGWGGHGLCDRNSPERLLHSHAVTQSHSDTVTPPAQPSREGSPISRSSSGTGSNKPVPAGKGKEAEVKDTEGTASDVRPGLRNKKNVDYKAAPPVQQIRAGSPPKKFKQLGKL